MSPKLTLLILLLINYSSSTDYCADEVQCKPPEYQTSSKNSACKCGFAGRCRDQTVHKTTSTARQTVIDLHNKYREKIASGEETRGGTSGTATQMYALQYDKELAHVINCWNKQCLFDHDECRRTESFAHAGQNLYISSGKTCDWTELDSAITGWYEEVADMAADCYASFPGSCESHKVGHFTQLAWAETTHVGCAMIEYDGQCQIGCNYGPAGNFLTQPVLKSGPVDCKFKSKKFAHLCLLTEDQEDKPDVGDEEDSSGNSLSRGYLYCNFGVVTMFNVLFG